MGPMSKIIAMIPGFGQGMNSELLDQHGGTKLKKYTCIMDSMNNKELDSNGQLFKNEPTRIHRIAKGSGVTIEEIQELMLQQEAVLFNL
jgi:signal recognition particle subunit SRP54